MQVTGEIWAAGPPGGRAAGGELPLSTVCRCGPGATSSATPWVTTFCGAPARPEPPAGGYAVTLAGTAHSRGGPPRSRGATYRTHVAREGGIVLLE